MLRTRERAASVSKDRLLSRIGISRYMPKNQERTLSQGPGGVNGFPDRLDKVDNYSDNLTYGAIPTIRWNPPVQSPHFWRTPYTMTRSMKHPSVEKHQIVGRDGEVPPIDLILMNSE